MTHGKTRYLIPSVTTMEALKACIEQDAMIFAIEHPLYASICDRIASIAELENYKPEWHRDKEIIVLFKIRGENQYDATIHQAVYLPLQWT